jgi:hypothetical protein
MALAQVASKVKKGGIFKAYGTENGDVFVAEVPGDITIGKKLALSLNDAAQANRRFDVVPSKEFMPLNCILKFSAGTSRNWEIDLLDGSSNVIGKLKDFPSDGSLFVVYDFAEIRNGLGAGFGIRFEFTNQVAITVDIYLNYKENKAFPANDGNS